MRISFIIIYKTTGGKAHVYRRANSRFWQCSTNNKNRNYRVSTKEESLEHARQIAENWYFELRGKGGAGLKTEKTFADGAAQVTKEYGIITEGQRDRRWVEGHQIRLRLHLIPVFAELGLSEVAARKVQVYRVHRR